MPARRYFIEASFKNGAVLELPKDESWHFIKVMRGRLQETVELINGKNCLATGTIIEMGKKSARIRIESCFVQTRRTVRRILCQGIPRANRLDSILEKATELGIDSIWLFPAERGEKLNVNWDRARSILIASIKQCGRLDLPSLLFCPPISSWGKDMMPEQLYFGDPEGKTFLYQSGRKNCNSLGIVIGPESGLSAQEKKKLENLGATGVKLHSNVLRTDTAALVAVAFIASF